MVFTKSQLHILTSQKKGELQSMGNSKWFHLDLDCGCFA